MYPFRTLLFLALCSIGHSIEANSINILVEGNIVPSSISIDNRDGSIYIADYWYECVLKSDRAGNLSLVAGNRSRGFSGDGGAATQAQLASPQGLFVHKGDIYIADTENHRIRKVDQNTGIITTIVGDGVNRFQGDGGPALSASLNRPFDLWIDKSDNLFIADRNNHRIRKVDGKSNIITTIAGDGNFSSDGYGRVKFNGDGQLATQVGINYPESVCVGLDGTIYITDQRDHRIRKIDSSGIITTIAGNGALSPVYYSGFELGNYFTELIGYAGQFGGDGGPASEASFNGPSDIIVDINGDIYVVDGGNRRIRSINNANGIVTTLAENSAYACIFFDALGNLIAGSQSPFQVIQINSVGSFNVSTHNISLADFDGNRKIDFSDFINFAIHFGTSKLESDFQSIFDITQDGVVNFTDFVEFAQYFGKEY